MAAKGNQFKKNKPEEKQEQEVKSSFSNPFKFSGTFFKNQKLHKITGLFFLFFSAYLLVAFTSFLFTWQNDQDKLYTPAWDLFFNTEITVDNWLGKIGAIVSHLFIHSWFGISSFIFILIFFLLGFRILFKISLLPLGKTLKYSFFSIIWLAVTLGYLFHSSYHVLGGAFGFHLSKWLNTVVGNIGTGLLLFFVFLSFLVISLNISFDFLKNILNKPEIEPEETGDEPGEKAPAVNTFKEPSSIKEQSSLELSILNETEEDIPEAEVINLEPELKKEIEPEKEDTAITTESLTFEVEKAEESEELTAEAIDQSPFGEYDPTLDLSSYKFPNIDLLEKHGSSSISINKEELEENKDKILETLKNYNIGIAKIKATVGPTVTLYEIIPDAGVRISKIKNLEDDIALSLSALGIRIIAPIPGKGTIGIEVPNQNPEMVSMRSVIASDRFQNADMELPIALGKTISNETFIFDLAKMPHLLMAGATGQGKSVGLNAILVSLLYKKHPSQIKFVLVDPKKVELTLFNKIERHFLAKLPDTEEAIITDTKKVVHTLNSLCMEMDQRYDLLKEAQVRNIKEYNAKFTARKLNPNNGHKFLPYIVLVVDEFADLIMTAGKEIETPIARLAQLARAIGIHLIIATQRPSVNIITGTIKANFPARIAFRVTSRIDSRTILDSGGADQLIGRGDMLLSTGNDLIRLQCAFVDTPEVESITDFIGSQRGYSEAFLLPEFIDETEAGNKEFNASDRDAMFEEAARIVVQHQQGSASLLQRRLKLGYNRAGRIIDQLEATGIIGPFEGSKARQVLITDLTSLEQLLTTK